MEVEEEEEDPPIIGTSYRKSSSLGIRQVLIIKFTNFFFRFIFKIVRRFGSKMNFHQQENGGVFPPSVSNRHVVSFRSVNRSSGMVQGNIGGPSGTSLPAECSNFGGGVSTSTTPGAFSGNTLEPGPTLRHETGLAVDWSCKEQAILKGGLVK